MGSQQPQHAGRLRLVGQREHGGDRPPAGPAAPAGPSAAVRSSSTAPVSDPVQTAAPATAAVPAAAPTTPVPAPVAAQGGFAEVLNAAIEHSGLSLDRIRAALAKQGVRVSVTTLSYWRRGRSQPERATSLRAVHLLEELLGLRHTALTALLGPPRPRGRWVAQGPAPDGLRVEQVWPRHPELAEVFAELDAPPTGQLERQSIHDAYYVDASRRGYLLRLRQVVRATVDGITRHVVVHKADEGTDTPEITNVRHARLGRVRRRPLSGLLVAELLLDRPLALGDSTILEYEVRIPDSGPTTDYGRYFANPVREYVLQVHFDPAAVPVQCERFDRTPGAETDRHREPLWIGASASAHVLTADQQPGQVGIRWQWE
ncbi:XRE family transcriptional regulator [Kitasatospora sp. NPDC004614]|uniref:XRE family transcriptional regulator n=1 Tax=unclassified Kitasatospora TaxID=2633591 RepID=UPI0036A57589